jgi:glycosyltransferase involved in cell wall biosynthesis
VDNVCRETLATHVDLSWHRQARHLRECRLGHVPARLCGIEAALGELLIFVDDDNVLSTDYLERAAAIAKAYPYIGVFGAGIVMPEFEVEPSPDVKPLLKMLALRTVSETCWTNNVSDYSCTPYGAGLCVPARIAADFRQLITALPSTEVLGRRGQLLFSADDDIFSWLSAGPNIGYGIFPELRLLHLISAERVRPDYFIPLIYGHTFSHTVLYHMTHGRRPKRPSALRWLRTLAHGVRNGRFSMRCQRSELKAKADALRFIKEHRLQLLPPEKLPAAIIERRRQTGELDSATVNGLSRLISGSSPFS